MLNFEVISVIILLLFAIWYVLNHIFPHFF